MANYTKTQWEVGQIIEATLMNKIEGQLELLTPKATAITDDYDSTASYDVGDYCFYGGLLWYCKTPVSGVTPAAGTYWKETKVLNEVGSGVGDSIASPYSTSSSRRYNLNDYVVYQRKLYRCTASTTGGTWDSTKWTTAILADDINDLIIISSSQPSSAVNRIWAQGDVSEVEVPTYEEFEDLVKVSSSEPSSSTNKIWIQNDVEEVKVPTYEEFKDVINDIVDGQSAEENITGVEWRKGWYDRNNNVYTSRNYFICTKNTIDISNYSYISVTPPTGYSAQVCLFDANGTRKKILGWVDGQAHPEAVDIVQETYFSDCTTMTISIGRFINNDAATYASNATFTSTILIKAKTLNANTNNLTNTITTIIAAQTPTIESGSVWED